MINWPKARADLNRNSSGGLSSSGRAASFALAIVLIVLSAAALLGATFSFWAGAAAKYSIAVSDAFEDARYAMGTEESLERAYRLEPSPKVRARHAETAASLLSALARVADLGAEKDLVAELVAKHKAYLVSVGHLFAAVDAGDAILAAGIDEYETDPSFDAMEGQLMRAATEHRADAAGRLDHLASIQKHILIATPLMFIPGMGLVIFFWSLLRRFRRQFELGLIRETAAVRRSEQRYRALLQNASDLVLICSPTGTITYQSPTAETAWGCAPGVLLTKQLSQLVHSDDQPALRELFIQLQTAPGMTRSLELQLQTLGTTWRNAELTLSNLTEDQSINGLVVTVRDVTQRKAFERQLTQQAFYDALTGLPNRVLLRDRLDQALARAERRQGTVGLLFIDLDNFKQINDSLGHHVGDTLLVEVATRLRSCTREENTVARLGGDEFVVLLEHLPSEADAVLAADRIAQQLSLPFRLQGRDFVITASIGIALGQAGDQADNMLRDADVAMYRAKSEGKGRHVVFDATMQVDARERLELENDLRQAVGRGELRVHYQPIVFLEEGGIAEVEALVRWQHPTRGLIPPLDFIPLAEATGLIIPVGQWVLEEACRQVVAWQRQFPHRPPLTVSVNLSPRQFQQPKLLLEVKRALRESGLPPANLKLEITEGVLMRDVEATITTLHELKFLGIQLAIDDFGTGYSSLAYLKRLPLDVLKIDRSFITGIGRNAEDTAIVRAIISMAKSLNLSITAEGIETAEQSTLLQDWACDRGQGYLFSKPMNAAGVTELLRASRFSNQSAPVE